MSDFFPGSQAFDLCFMIEVLLGLRSDGRITGNLKSSSEVIYNSNSSLMSAQRSHVYIERMVVVGVEASLDVVICTCGALTAELQGTLNCMTGLHHCHSSANHKHKTRSLEYNILTPPAHHSLHMHRILAPSK